jgi:hypothetical protein
MRRLLMVLLMLSVAGTAMAAVSTGNTGSSPVIKGQGTGSLYVGPTIDPLSRTLGDIIEEPFILPVVPNLGTGQATGTTDGFVDDYNEVCPFSPTGAPDVVYMYTPIESRNVSFTLCASSYDTKLYIYEDTYTSGLPYACNDDDNVNCTLYQSSIWNLNLLAGHVYYIVIDGYDAYSHGDYVMDVIDNGPSVAMGACCALSGICTITYPADCVGEFQGENTACVVGLCPAPPQILCPTGALVEGEPSCLGIDNFNGGCNSTPNIWSALDPQTGGCATLCGLACADGTSRDTDWYESIGTGGIVTVSCTAAFPLQLLLITGTDCAAPVYTAAVVAPGVAATLSATVADGAKVWIWVGPDGYDYVWPESNYVLDICGIKAPPPPPGACCKGALCIVTTPEVCTFSGGIFKGSGVLCEPTPCDPTPTEHKSWGALKNLYR